MTVVSRKTTKKNTEAMCLSSLFNYYSADGYRWSSETVTPCDLDTWVGEYMLGSTKRWLKNFLTEDLAGAFDDEAADITHWDFDEAVAYLDARLDAFAYADALTLETTIHDLFSNDGVTLVDLYEDMVTRFYSAPVGSF